MESQIIVPIFGILTGIIVPVSAFIWMYYEGKGKREVVLEISKHLDDPSKLEELLRIFDERKATNRTESHQVSREYLRPTETCTT